MRIQSTERAKATSKSKGKNKASAGGAFVPQHGEAAQNTSTNAVAITSPIASIDTLIALQEGEDFRQAKKAATLRADALLDVLSDVRIGLLEGAVPLRALQRLDTTLKRTRAQTGDPRLESILDDVEIRAAVEKAKLDSAR